MPTSWPSTRGQPWHRRSGRRHPGGLRGGGGVRMQVARKQYTNPSHNLQKIVAENSLVHTACSHLSPSTLRIHTCPRHMHPGGLLPPDDEDVQARCSHFMSTLPHGHHTSPHLCGLLLDDEGMQGLHPTDKLLRLQQYSRDLHIRRRPEDLEDLRVRVGEDVREWQRSYNKGLQWRSSQR